MMECTTAASVITYVSKIELDSAKLYEQWGKLHEKLRDSFEAFAKANKKNEQRVKRAYYSVVSDALETNFCFKDLRADIVMPEFSKGASVSEVLNLAVTLEKEIRNFYVKAANSSRALLPDVPRQMDKVSQERTKRVEQLQAMTASNPDG
jgi:rubrerythrin